MFTLKSIEYKFLNADYDLTINNSILIRDFNYRLEQLIICLTLVLQLLPGNSLWSNAIMFDIIISILYECDN